jgi:DNA-directed RNA polymerase sigma subunit (sigma70/sigma32)
MTGITLIHDNCVLCLIDDKGAMTQEQVASYLNIAKECVHVIEKRALKKLTRLMKRNNFINVPPTTI